MAFSSQAAGKNAKNISLSGLPLSTSNPMLGKDINKHHVKPHLKGHKHIERLPQSKIDKIGSKTLIDKQWADRPMAIIKNPHKLSEVELY